MRTAARTAPGMENLPAASSLQPRSQHTAACSGKAQLRRREESFSGFTPVPRKFIKRRLVVLHAVLALRQDHQAQRVPADRDTVYRHPLFTR